LANRLRGYTGKNEEKFWETCKTLHKVPSGNLKLLLDGVEKNIGKYDLKIGKHKFLVLLERYAKRLNSSTRCLREIQSEMENIEQDIVYEAWHHPVDTIGFKVAEKMLDESVNVKQDQKKKNKDCELSFKIQKQSAKVRSNREVIQAEIDKAKKKYEAVKKKAEGQLAQQKTLLEEKKKLETQLNWPGESQEVIQLLSAKKKIVDGKILGIQASANTLVQELKKADIERSEALNKMTKFNKQIEESMKNPKVQRVVNGIAKLSRADDKREAIQKAHQLKKKLNL